VKEPVIFDVGANVGKYSNLIREFSPSASIFAFEPHPETFKVLQDSANPHRYTAINVALTDSVGTTRLYDYELHDNQKGSEHASLVEGVIESVHGGKSVEWEVQTTTVDEFRARSGTGRIDLLKIDVEGNELKVLKGASQSLEQRQIDIIHFEFTEANMVSRTLMKDFFNLLPEYDLFRMLPDGLAPLGAYYVPLAEIFYYQNIVAIRRGTRGWSQ
jgi:methyltransferase, FkbM family